MLRRPAWVCKGKGTREGSVATNVEARALQFTRLNWILLGTAAVFIVVGYFALATESPFVSTVLAPVLLVAAYAVLIPLGLIL